MSFHLICPYDRHSLTETDSDFACEICGKHYFIRDGVICMLEHADDFYEGAFENQVKFIPRSDKWWHIWPLWLINSGYLWAIRRFIPQDALIVEFGCAAGVRYLGQRYRMIGCDLSFTSLRKFEFYDHRIQTDAATCIPLPDNSVDAVISSYFWEHIPPNIKPDILKECQRILKKDGKVIFLYDVETENPLIYKMKKINMKLYNTLFINNDGHIGYETLENNEDKFIDENYKIIKSFTLERTPLQSASVYEKCMAWPGIIGKFGMFMFYVTNNKLLFYCYILLVRVIDETIGRLCPSSWGRIAITIAKK